MKSKRISYLRVYSFNWLIAFRVDSWVWLMQLQSVTIPIDIISYAICLHMLHFPTKKKPNNERENWPTENASALPFYWYSWLRSCDILKYILFILSVVNNFFIVCVCVMWLIAFYIAFCIGHTAKFIGHINSIFFLLFISFEDNLTLTWTLHNSGAYMPGHKGIGPWIIWNSTQTTTENVL